VLFMTDGFAERLGADDELLGYDRALAAFRTAAPAGAAEIITSLRATAETWAGGRPADDDVTFVVLKMR
jgi:serine phosphatase RsbU (regulator of sigma subunit)